MSKTDELLKEFLQAPKPSWVIPSDVAVMAQLILLGEIKYADRQAVCARCGLSDDKALLRSLKRMEAAGWAYKGESWKPVQDFVKKHKEAFKEQPKGEPK